MCVRMTAALALLPANRIDEGFEEIKTYALARFFTYFSR